MASRSAPIQGAAQFEHLKALLRFAVGVTATFVLCEAFGWYPTFLAAILTATLLGSLPGALPIKAGVALVIVQAVGAFLAFMLSSLLRDTPTVLFGIISVIIFISFAAIAQGKSFLPILLVLICFATIPIVAMLSPAQAEPLLFAFPRGMALAVGMIWLVHAIWPKLEIPTVPPASGPRGNPIAVAVAGTLIVIPLMLLYLMYAITDALPVLITTIVLVVNFDRKRGAMQGLAMMLGNLIGGMVALSCYMLLRIVPSLTSLALIVFIVALLFAERMQRGGPGASVALVTFNQALVILSLALMPGASGSIWGPRLLQFAIACLFAIGMMILLLPRDSAQKEMRPPAA